MKGLIGLMIATLFLSSCSMDDWNSGSFEATWQHEIKQLDGVKLISPEITKATKSSTFTQSVYALDNVSRLLIRFESLTDYSGQISTSSDDRVFLELVPAGGLDVDANPYMAQGLTLCPLTKNWMMLATWYQAHPFVNGGWDHDGGDYDEARCVSGSIPAYELDEDEYSTESNRILFDITDWTLDYLKAMGTNYGWVLMSENTISIHGDASSSYYPRIIWKKWN